MSETVLWIALVVHILLCILYYFLTKIGVAHLNGTAIPTMLFIPFFGPVSILMVEWVLIKKKDGLSKTDLHKTKLENGIYNKVTVDERDNPDKIVPLEEAILIDDVPTRRGIMLDILHRDPVQFLDLLMIARFNSDIEVTHYATTSIMEIQREFEIAIQKTSAAVKMNPEDVNLLDKFIDLLSKYIDSGLLHGHILRQQRIHYSIALEKKRAMFQDHKQTYFRIIDNDIGLKEFTHAEETAQIMQQKWSSDEEVWFSTMRVYVESGNSEGKTRLVKQMRQTPIEWTASGKERMFFWGGTQFFQTHPSTDEGNSSTAEKEAI
jgi:hypothetical protein